MDGEGKVFGPFKTCPFIKLRVICETIKLLLLSTIFHSSVGSLMTPYPLELLVVDRRARLQWNIQLIPQSDSLGMLSDGIIQLEKVTITQFQQATF